ncbi:uncharacterized protein AB675_3748 [Cyphellophora attinorum]|uniref:Uncharacterized protein n=1 Tax=Cyphellophora attinorum TaxID=1664694 RepID=A0A0N0NIC3_9EURO|nr:uncharacterized protein AB675_3748 [Phialophora attinorum]KPI35269.1 hypothetical protein AB675_3748 [Phialophora attinorum]
MAASQEDVNRLCDHLKQVFAVSDTAFKELQAKYDEAANEIVALKTTEASQNARIGELEAKIVELRALAGVKLHGTINISGQLPRGAIDITEHLLSDKACEQYDHKIVWKYPKQAAYIWRGVWVELYTDSGHGVLKEVDEKVWAKWLREGTEFGMEELKVRVMIMVGRDRSAMDVLRRAEVPLNMGVELVNGGIPLFREERR